MARKNKSSSFLEQRTVRGILAILSFATGLILTFAAVGKAGIIGERVYRALTNFLGIGYPILPVLAFFLCFGFLNSLARLFPPKKTVAAFLLFLSGLGIINLIFPTEGGTLGHFVSAPLGAFFEVYSALVLLGALFIIALLILFEDSLTLEVENSWLVGLFRKRREPVITGLNDELEDETAEAQETMQSTNGENTEVERPGEQKDETKTVVGESREAPRREHSLATPAHILPRIHRGAYTPPPLSLLEPDRGKPGVGDIKANANIIKRTLQNFGIEVEMDEISIGPAVTRYALKPAENVRLSKIVALQRELELALAAHPLRIEAPIPGKSLVGIEIPNSIKATVGLATMLAAPEFSASEKPLLVSLGKDLSGKAHFANLSKMPHLLIAGATGSGKSVTIHSVITSLLFRNSPDDLRLILVDPKRVELTLYNKVPHLLTPVITEAKKTILALKWAAKEMDRRYDILESESVRDIHSYHKNIVEPELKKLGKNGTEATKNVDADARMPEALPHIVIIIDELADIMSLYPRELETAVVRLAQMSRATGIHLVLSTQRPSVNVITGLIKANIPARIALQVASQIDSRTILDTSGAEKLLGSGDMLFLSGEMSKPMRLQSAFISEAEVKKVAGYLGRAYPALPPEDLVLSEEIGTEGFSENGGLGDDEVDDTLYEEAREWVLKAGKASTSYLQRRLRVGYARAARIMDMLEERGVIGPADGSKPRSVIDIAIPTDEAVSEDTKP